MKSEMYENSYQRPRHFSFGRNWQDFLDSLAEARVVQATDSLAEFVRGVVDLRDKSWLDVGAGSGLSSLAACRLGASPVLSFDVDLYSTECAEFLRAEYKLTDVWQVEQGSVLDKSFLATLSTFDVVYSWGVLHHTGDMWQSLKNVIPLMKKGGYLYLAIYNNNKKYYLEGTSRFWRQGKKFYNEVPGWLKKMAVMLYATYILTGITLHGRNPVKYVREYKRFRGMNFMTDIKDWLGGYPYEFASPNEVVSFMAEQGLRCVKQKPARSLGCNEFLFEKD